MNIIEELKRKYEEFYLVGHLNEEGLKWYIRLLRGDIKDHSQRIKEVVKEKGLHTQGKTR